VCGELKHLILKRKEISEDGHLIWDMLFDIRNTKWDELESDDEDEPVEMCPTTSTTSTDHHASTLKEEEEGMRNEGKDSLGEAVKPSPRGSLTALTGFNLLW
jgi:hypothetical protein